LLMGDDIQHGKYPWVGEFDEQTNFKIS